MIHVLWFGRRWTASIYSIIIIIIKSSHGRRTVDRSIPFVHRHTVPTGTPAVRSLTFLSLACIQTFIHTYIHIIFYYRFYGLSCLFFAYAEGYKGFQLKFSPLVVKRSFSLVIGTRQGNSVLNFVLAPLYSMGLMHATRKRLITSWSVSLGVATIVAVVKKLPPVWRCILDAGVVVGLSYGSLSILILFFNAWRTGKAPAVDACLPLEKKTAASTASVAKKKK